MDFAGEAMTSGNAGCERKAAGQLGVARRPSLQGPIGGAGEGRPLPLLLMERYVCARVSQECLRQRAITLACDLCVCDLLRGLAALVTAIDALAHHVFGTYRISRESAFGRPGHDEVGNYSKLWAGTGAGPGAAAGAAGGATVHVDLRARPRACSSAGSPPPWSRARWCVAPCAHSCGGPAASGGCPTRSRYWDRPCNRRPRRPRPRPGPGSVPMRRRARRRPRVPAPTRQPARARQRSPLR